MLTTLEDKELTHVPRPLRSRVRARRAAPRTALGTLTFAAQFLDELCFTRATNRIGGWGLWPMVLLLSTIWLGGTFGPPPADEHALAVTTLGIWLFVPWSYWVDRHRVPSAGEEGR